MAEQSQSVAPQTDHRPWGDSIVLADEADHKVKRVTVLGGKRSSLQRHQKRSEHWFVLNTPEYKDHSKDMRMAANKLKKAATNRNLEAAALRYFELTVTCIDCHQYITTTKY